MKSFLRSPERRPVVYASLVHCESTVLPGVRYKIRRMSFGARIELSQKIRALSKQIDFLAAGSDVQQHLEANVLSHEIDDIFLAWGLIELDGLTIDGERATPELLVSKGPDALTREIVDAIRGQCGLTEDERKN